MKSQQTLHNEWLKSLQERLGEGYSPTWVVGQEGKKVVVTPYDNSQPLVLDVNIYNNVSKTGPVPVVGGVNGKSLDFSTNGVIFGPKVFGKLTPAAKETFVAGVVTPAQREKIDVQGKTGTEMLALGIITSFEKSKQEGTLWGKEFSTIASNVNDINIDAGTRPNPHAPIEAQHALMRRVAVELDAPRFQEKKLFNAIKETIIGNRAPAFSTETNFFKTLLDEHVLPDKQGNLSPTRGSYLETRQADNSVVRSYTLFEGSKVGISKPSIVRGGSNIALPLSMKTNDQGFIEYERMRPENITDANPNPQFAVPNVRQYGGEKNGMEVENILFGNTILPGAAFRFYNPNRKRVDAYGRDDASLKVKLPESVTPDLLLSGGVKFDMNAGSDETGQFGFGSGSVSIGKMTASGSELDLRTSKGENPMFPQGKASLVIPDYWNPKTRTWGDGSGEGDVRTTNVAKQLRKKYPQMRVQSASVKNVTVSQSMSQTTSARYRGLGFKMLEALTGQTNSVNVGGKSQYIDLFTAEAKSPALNLQIFSAMTNQQQSAIIGAWADGQKKGSADYEAAQSVSVDLERQLAGGSRRKAVDVDFDRLASVMNQASGGSFSGEGRELATRIIQEQVIDKAGNKADNDFNLERGGLGYIEKTMNLGPVHPEHYELIKDDLRRASEAAGHTPEQFEKNFAETFTYGREKSGDLPILEQNVKGFMARAAMVRVSDNDTSKSSASHIFQEGVANMDSSVAEKLGIHPTQNQNLSKQQMAAANLLSYAAYQNDVRNQVNGPAHPNTRTVSDDEAISISQIPTDIEGKDYAERVSTALGMDKEDLSSVLRIGEDYFPNPNVIANEQYQDIEGNDLGGLGTRYMSSISSSSREQMYPDESLNIVKENKQNYKSSNALYLHTQGLRAGLYKKVREKNLPSSFRGRIVPNLALAPTETSADNQLLGAMAKRISKQVGTSYSKVMKFVQNSRFGHLFQRDPGMNRGADSITVGENIPRNELRARVGEQTWNRMQQDMPQSTGVLSGTASMREQKGDLDSDTGFYAAMIETENGKLKTFGKHLQYESPVKSILDKERYGFATDSAANSFNAFVQSSMDIVSGVDPFSKNAKKAATKTYGEHWDDAALKMHPAAPIGKAYGAGQTFNSAHNVTKGERTDRLNFEADYITGIDHPELGDTTLSAAVSGSNLGTVKDGINAGVDFVGYARPIKDGQEYPETNRIMFGGTDPNKSSETGRGMQTFVHELIGDITAPHNGEYLRTSKTVSTLLGTDNEDIADIQKSLDAAAPSEWKSILQKRNIRNYKSQGQEAMDLKMSQTDAVSGLFGRAVGKRINEENASLRKYATQLSGGDEAKGQELYGKWHAIGVSDQLERKTTYASEENIPGAQALRASVNSVGSGTQNILSLMGISKLEGPESSPAASPVAQPQDAPVPASKPRVPRTSPVAQTPNLPDVADSLRAIGEDDYPLPGQEMGMRADPLSLTPVDQTQMPVLSDTAFRGQGYGKDRVSRNKALKSLEGFLNTWSNEKDKIVDGYSGLLKDLDSAGYPVMQDGSVAESLRDLTGARPNEAVNIRSRWRESIKSAGKVREARNMAFAYVKSSGIDPTDERWKSKLEVLDQMWKPAASEPVDNLADASLGLRSGEANYNVHAGLSAQALGQNTDLIALHGVMEEQGIIGQGADPKNFVSGMKNILRSPENRRLLSENRASIQQINPQLRPEFATGKQMELFHAANFAAKSPEIGAKAFKGDIGEKLQFTEEAFLKLANVLQKVEKNTTELTAAYGENNKEEIKRLETERAKLAVQEKAAVAGSFAESHRAKAAQIGAEMVSQAAFNGGQVDESLSKSYLDNISKAQKFEKQAGEMFQEEDSKRDPVGKAARKLLGGFGLMYMNSIKGYMMSGLGDDGQQEAQAYNEQVNAVANQKLGGSGTAFNQSRQLANVKGVYGTNYSVMTAMEQASLRSGTNAKEVGNAALSGIATWGASNYFLDEIRQVSPSLFKQGEAGNRQIANLSLGLGMASTVANLGLQAYQKSQDPESLAFRMSQSQQRFGAASGLFAPVDTYAWMMSSKENKQDIINKSNFYSDISKEIGTGFSAQEKEDMKLGNVSGDQRDINKNLPRPAGMSDQDYETLRLSSSQSLKNEGLSWNRLAELGAARGVTSERELLKMGASSYMVAKGGEAFDAQYHAMAVDIMRRNPDSTWGTDEQNIATEQAIAADFQSGKNTRDFSKRFLGAQGYNVSQMNSKTGPIDLGDGRVVSNALDATYFSSLNMSETEQETALAGADFLSKLKGANKIAGWGREGKKFSDDEKLNAEFKIAYAKIAESITGTYGEEAAVSSFAAYDSGIKSGRLPASTPPPVLQQFEHMTEEQGIRASESASAQYQADQQAIGIGSNVQAQSYFYNDTTTGDRAREQLKGTSGSQMMFMNRVMNADPMALTASGLGGVNYGPLKLSTIDGGTYDASYLGMSGNTDIGMNGRMTGMSWGSTSLQSASPFGGIVSSAENAKKIFGNNWQTNDRFSQGLIGAMVGGVKLDAPIQTALGEVSSIGGIQGANLYMNRVSEQFTLDNINRQQQSADLDYSYTMKSWKIQDQSRAASNKYQEWQFGFQQRQLDMNKANFAENTALDRTQTMTQRGYTQEDWAFNDNVRGLQWGWKQEDFAEESRFMTGRNRKKAERQNSRDTVMHNLEGDQIEKGKERQKEMWQLEDKRFEVQKKQFAESAKMQQESLNRNKEYYEERKKLEEQEIKFQREHYKQQVALQKQATAAQIAYTKEQYAMQRAMQQVMLAMQMNSSSQNTLSDGYQTLITKTVTADDQLRKLAETIGTVGNAAQNASNSSEPEDYPEDRYDGQSSSDAARNAPVDRIAQMDMSNRYVSNQTDFIPMSGNQAVAPANITIYIGNEKISDFIVDTISKEIRSNG